MSTSGVHPDDMDPLSAHHEELLLTGRVPDDQAEFEGVAMLFARLRDHAAAAPAPALGPELATLFRDGAPALAPAAVRPVAVSRRHPRRVAAAVAAAAGFLGMSGLGVAGALPGPAQAAVARVADVVGIDLPDGRPDPLPPTDTTPAADPATPAEPPATPGEGPANPAIPATPARPTTPAPATPGRPESPPSSVPIHAGADGQQGSPPAHAPATGRPAEPGEQRASQSEDRPGTDQPGTSDTERPDPAADESPARSDEHEPGAPSTSLFDRFTSRGASNPEATGPGDGTDDTDTTGPARSETARDDAGGTP